MKSKQHVKVVFLIPGFPANEQDSTCMPAIQSFFRALLSHYHPDELLEAIDSELIEKVSKEVKSAIIQALKIQGGDTTAQALLDKVLSQTTTKESIVDLAKKYGYASGSTGWFSGDEVPGFEDNKDWKNQLPGRV